jgi:hypothetical protein
MCSKMEVKKDEALICDSCLPTSSTSKMNVPLLLKHTLVE